jgi:hypothetical protein
MHKVIGVFVGLATLAGVVGVTHASGTAVCQPETQAGTTGVTLYGPPSAQGPDDSVAGSCTYVSSNGAHNAQTWNSVTPNSFTITVNDGQRAVVVENHGDLADPRDPVVDRGAFTAPRGSVVTVSLLNGCPKPGACGSGGTVSTGAPDAPGSATPGGGGGVPPGTISVAGVGSVYGRAARLTMSCAGGAACAGDLEIEAGGANSTKRHQERPKPVVVTKGSYSVPPGTTQTLRLALTKNGKALLKKRHGTLVTKLEITPAGGQTTTQTLKLVRKQGKGRIASVSRAPAVRPVVLPRDHGAHPGFTTEWWYTAGTLGDAKGRDYFWFATIWSAGGALVAKVNVVDLRADRVVLSHEYLSTTPLSNRQTQLGVEAFHLGPSVGQLRQGHRRTEMELVRGPAPGR